MQQLIEVFCRGFNLLWAYPIALLYMKNHPQDCITMFDKMRQIVNEG